MQALSDSGIDFGWILLAELYTYSVYFVFGEMRNQCLHFSLLHEAQPREHSMATVALLDSSLFSSRWPSILVQRTFWATMYNSGSVYRFRQKGDFDVESNYLVWDSLGRSNLWKWWVKMSWKFVHRLCQFEIAMSFPRTGLASCSATLLCVFGLWHY